MSGTRSRRSQAEVRRSAWPGWIWAVPIAAFGVAGWLGIRALLHQGETVTVTFDNAYGMKPGDTHVTLRGVKVGSVSDIALAPDGQHVQAKLDIDRAEKKYLRSSTKFFLRGAQMDLSDPSSIKGLLSGPEIVMEPGPGEPASRFDGVDRRPALTPGHGPIVTYLLRFEGAVGELKNGADVQLRGFDVGTVTSVRLNYDAGTGALSTPVQIALDPSQLGIVGVAPPANGNWRPLVDSMLEHLVAEGLRARLSQDPPLVGPRKINLDFVKGAPGTTLATANGIPVIPSVASADLDTTMSKANEVIAKIDDLPIKETGEQVRSIAAHVNALSSSPQIRDGLTHIDQAVAQIDRTLQQVSPQIGPLVAQLRETANAADRTVAAANRTLGADASSQNDLPAALRELTDTARSVRALADYLDRHPEALVRGRQKETQ
ncbi:Mammalian cell entry related domain protein [Paraburkholderia ribeironis]|uniref:Mammalian cell entry related domain protein n=1 Tax=Paraburkholderia ribeironis TaxID=1247936 RepID=A0A1N7RTB8_9BURK|nr:MlaD family protein [Paraburkholderia ribeironis]SIT38351.1 Mammalian cell entry related domain protein [Paraburkholderia ribeironis]